MENLALFWAGVGILCIIVEIFTAAFYGLSLAVAAFCVMIFAFIFTPQQIDVWQAIIFLVIAALASYFFPKMLTPKTSKNVKQGLDIYIGQSHKVEKIGDDYKVFLDGVPYLVTSEMELSDGEMVKILARKGANFIVTK